MLRIVVGAAVVLAAAAAWGVWRRIDLAKRAIREHAARAARDMDAFAKSRRGRGPLIEPKVEGTAESVRRAFDEALWALPVESGNRIRAGTAGPDELERVIAAHPELLAVADRLLRVPDEPGTYGDLRALTMPRDISSLESWLADAARRALSRGDSALATTLALAVAVSGSDVARQGGFLIHEGIESEVRGTRLVGAALAARADPTTVRRARDVLARIEDARAPFTATFAWMHAGTRTALASPEMTPDIAREAGFEHLWSDAVLRAEILDNLDAISDEVEKALSGAHPNLYESIRRVRTLHGARDPIRTYPEFMAERMQQHQKGSVWNRVATVTCAVALAAGRDGAFPKSLESLVPDLLPAVPIDPWSGKPLRYDPATGTVWSLGPDGTDEGGAPVAHDVPDPPDFALRPAAAK